MMMKILSSFKLRFVIALLTFALLWFAVNRQLDIFLAALLPTLAQILLADISYRNKRDHEVVEAVSQTVEELKTFPSRNSFDFHKPTVPPKKKRKAANTPTPLDDQLDHYNWLLERGVITNRQYSLLIDPNNQRS